MDGRSRVQVSLFLSDTLWLMDGNCPPTSGIIPVPPVMSSSVAELSSSQELSQLPGFISLSLPNDSKWLSPSVCLLREQIEVFAATSVDIAERRSGPKPSPGTVGLRCRHCMHLPSNCRSRGSVVYPKSISLMHQAIRNFQRYHFFQCSEIPQRVKDRFVSFRPNENQSKKGASSYWIQSSEQEFDMIDVEGDGTHVLSHVRFRSGPQGVNVPNAAAASAASAAIKTESSPEEDSKISGTKRRRAESSESSSDLSPTTNLTAFGLSPGTAAAFAGFDFAAADMSASGAVKTESSPEDSKPSGTKRRRRAESSSAESADLFASELSPGKVAAFDGLDMEEHIEIHHDHVAANTNRQHDNRTAEGESRSGSRKNEYSSRSA
mmetsp:Transcript_15708/g.31708  ORF Transcript_15708/g.31708 Transcript_15708/m.31708 type:complete len:379 (-) Transcript_15708:453-1589(-)